MSPASAHAGEHSDARADQVYHFGASQFFIWNDELQDFTASGGPQWRFDYSFLPQLPQRASPQVLKDIANPSDTKSPSSATFASNQPYMCAATLLHASPANVDGMEGGLGIDNVDTTPEQAARSRTPVPAIVTEPATRNNTVDEGQMAQQPIQGFHAPYMHSAPQQFTMTPPQAGYVSEYINGVPHSTSALQDAFQFQSPVTRRNSVSSCNSGPVFSHYGTPISTYQHEGAYQITPQSNQHGRFAQWSPHSPSTTWRPQSRKQSTNSLSRMNQQYISNLQKQRGSAAVAMTMPSRRKPRIEHSLSESSLFNNSPSQSTTGLRSSDGRRRAASVVGQRTTAEPPAIQTSVQLQLPVFQPDRMFTSPVCTQSGFPTPDPCMFPMGPHSNLTPSFTVGNYMTPDPQQQINMSPSPTAGGYIQPSEPPQADFRDKPQAQIPIFQAPQFDGDIYTPQYKRRNAKGEWEGWCGLCQPGQWHNLKNSRYWDDKLRNHGICARTKRKFEDPIQFRVVNLEGNIIDLSHELGDAGDMRNDEWVVSGLDGSLRKREGLCGYCREWIAMDGVRSKGKGKSVGWWSHAYKCHEQGRKSAPTDRLDTQSQMQSQYHPLPSEQGQHTHYLNQPMYFSHSTNASYNNC